jgi:ATP-binding cassette subfamily B protein
MERAVSHTTRRLAEHCLRHRPALAAVAVASVVVAGITAAVPLVQRAIVDDVIVAHRVPLAPLILVLSVAAVIDFGAVFVRRWAAGKLSLHIQDDLRGDMFASLVRLDGRGQDRLETGQVIGKAGSDLSAVQALLEELPANAGNAVQFLLSVVVMATISPTLTVVALVVGPLMWLVSRFTYRLIPPVSRRVQQQTGALADVLNSAIAGVRIVKGFAQEQREQSKMEQIALRMFGSRLDLIRLRAWLGSLIGTVSALGQVGVLGVGGWLAVRGDITVGTFLAFSTYLALLMGPARTLASLIPMVQQTMPSVERIFELIDARPTMTEPDDTSALPDGPLDLELDDVCFGYDEPLLTGLSLRVEAGRTIALLGASGSGKSTIAALAERFYDVRGGAIRLGGHDVRTLRSDALRSAVGLVHQDAFLFQDTIRANLAHGRPGASRDEIEAAAHAAEIHDFVTGLPDGYDTQIGEGGLTLSGGQRQRLALARTLLGDPRVLVLDDATSAVDARTELAIHDNLRTLLPGRATLLIAHRPASLALADRIAVLDEGRIVDVGTAEQLQRRCAAYRRLVSEPDLTPTDESSSALLVPPVSTVDDVPTAPIDIDRARAADPRFRFGALLRPLGWRLPVGLLLVAATSASILALPLVVRDGIDLGINRSDLHAIWITSLLGVGVVAAGFALSVVQSLVTGGAGERLLFALRTKAFAHLQRLGMDYYDREGSGPILTRMTVDIDTLGTFLQSELANGLSSLLWFVGIGAVLLTVDLRLGLALLAVQPILAVATLVYRSRSSVSYRQARERTSLLTRDLVETISGLRVIQTHRLEGASLARFCQHGKDFLVTRMRAQRQLAGYLAFVQLLSDASTIIVLALGARWVGAGTLTTGVLAAFLLYIDMFLSPVQALSQFFDSYQQAAVGLRRIGELLRAPVSPAVDPSPVPLAGRLSGKIVIDNVGFTYAGHGREALTDVSLTIAPGQTVVLVGATGAGKSTLVKLLARFHDVTSGAILADGVDLRRLDPAGYRGRLGIVPQESYLFPGTVWDNLTYGQPDATAAEVEAAVRAVGAYTMLAALAGGYGHVVTAGGRNLSAGQRQLVALARAHLVDPDILLMDEATAALDPASEAAVNRAAAVIARPRTTVVVSHRLTTAVTADLVVVLDDGRVVEQGTHQELVLAGGTYASLWSAYADTR